MNASNETKIIAFYSIRYTHSFIMMKPRQLLFLFLFLGSTVAHQQEEHLRHPTATTSTATSSHHDYHRNAQALTVTASSTHYGFDTSSTKDSCSTLHNCLDCVSAGCSWTQSLLYGNNLNSGNGGSATVTNSSVRRENAGNAAASATAPFEDAAASVNKLAVSQCVPLCDGVGTDASCFRLGNYIGLDAEEVCHIAEQMGDITVEEETVESPQLSQEAVTLHEEEGSMLSQEEAEATEQAPMQNLEVTNLQFSPTTSSQEPSQGPTPSPTPLEGVPTETPTIISISGFVVISATAVPTPIPCTGFISCQRCKNNTQHRLACAFVASDSCQNVCPELAHVPCYEANGNYTTMTQEAVCAAAGAMDSVGQGEQDPSLIEGVGFGDDMPQVATSALRSDGGMTFGSGNWILFAGIPVVGRGAGILFH